MDLTSSFKALLFMKDAYAKIVGTSETLFDAKIDADLATLYMQGTDLHGQPVYDKQDRPLHYALLSKQKIESLLSSDPNNYIKAKSLVVLAKIKIQKNQGEDGEILIKRALEQIDSEFTCDHPMSAKFEQSMVEALNARPESGERTELICKLCESSLRTCQEHFG